MACATLFVACGARGSTASPSGVLVTTADAGDSAQAQAEAYYQRGVMRLEQHAASEALRDFAEALRLDPAHSAALIGRADAYVDLGEAKAALRDYAEAIRLDPQAVAAYKGRLSLLEQQGDLQALAADYGQLAVLDPFNQASYYYAQGNVLGSIQDLEGARRAYDAALVADSTHSQARYERALLRLAADDAAGAMADLDQVLKAVQQPKAFYARGLAHSALGEYLQAHADFSAALALRADYAEALLGRAAASYAVGDYLAARADLEQLDRLSLDVSLQSAAARLREQLATES